MSFIINRIQRCPQLNYFGGHRIGSGNGNVSHFPTTECLRVCGSLYLCVGEAVTLLHKPTRPTISGPCTQHCHVTYLNEWGHASPRKHTTHR